MVSTLLLTPSLLFTTLHPSTLHSTSLPFHLSYGHLNFLRSISPHITTLHLTSLHCTFRLFLPHFYSFHFTLFIIAFLTVGMAELSGLHLWAKMPHCVRLVCSNFQGKVIKSSLTPVLVIWRQELYADSWCMCHQ
jgi:hypothetical protein